MLRPVRRRGGVCCISMRKPPCFVGAGGNRSAAVPLTLLTTIGRQNRYGARGRPVARGRILPAFELVAAEVSTIVVEHANRTPPDRPVPRSELTSDPQPRRRPRPTRSCGHQGQQANTNGVELGEGEGVTTGEGAGVTSAVAVAMDSGISARRIRGSADGGQAAPIQRVDHLSVDAGVGQELMVGDTPIQDETGPAVEPGRSRRHDPVACAGDRGVPG